MGRTENCLGILTILIVKLYNYITIPLLNAGMIEGRRMPPSRHYLTQIFYLDLIFHTFAYHNFMRNSKNTETCCLTCNLYPLRCEMFEAKKIEPSVGRSFPKPICFQWMQACHGHFTSPKPHRQKKIGNNVTP